MDNKTLAEFVAEENFERASELFNYHVNNGEYESIKTAIRLPNGQILMDLIKEFWTRTKAEGKELIKLTGKVRPSNTAQGRCVSTTGERSGGRSLVGGIG
jgi:hypothetical protein